MTITAAIVLYSICWFMTFLIVLPLRLVTQADAGEVVPGTHRSAPADVQIGKRARITTVVATVLWAVLTAIILSGAISIRDLEMLQRFGPEGGTLQAD